jgi:hypothetical protein
MKIDFRLRSEKTDRWISLNVVADGKDKKLADKLRAATKDWEFKIADWRARQTFKAPKELFEAVKAPAPKTQPLKPTPGTTSPGVTPTPAPAAPTTPAPATGPDPASGPGAAKPKQ